MRRSLSPQAALLGLSLLASGCVHPYESDSGPERVHSDYTGAATGGGGYVDQDGDGYSIEEGDCDDEDALRHPAAEETPGDGIDSNCDGEDDT